MSNASWLFEDNPNVAVFTDRRILEGHSFIYYVGHDANDGAWQFHGPEGFTNEVDAKVVGLKTIVELDPSIVLLVDLPRGWCAWRESVDEVWKRVPQQL